MNTESETVNGINEENIQSGAISNDDCHNGELDTQFECKQEIHSEGEDEQTCVDKQQMTVNYTEVSIKEESNDPKGTTEDERYILLDKIHNRSPQPYHISGKFFHHSTPLWLGWVKPIQSIAKLWGHERNVFYIWQYILNMLHLLFLKRCL